MSCASSAFATDSTAGLSALLWDIKASYPLEAISFPYMVEPPASPSAG